MFREKHERKIQQKAKCLICPIDHRKQDVSRQTFHDVSQKPACRQAGVSREKLLMKRGKMAQK
jgi:hypothetical protein